MSPSLSAQIRNWLTTEDYTEGLRLFRDRFGETIRYQTFSYGDSQHNREKLKELLTEGLTDPVDTQEKHPFQETSPDIIEQWRKSTYELMDERILLKQCLRDSGDDELDRRKQTAFRILEITASLDLLFNKLDYFEKFRRVPESEAIKPDSRQLPQEVLNLRSYISRTQKQLHPGDCECKGCIKRKEKIQTWFLKIREIETELNR